MIHTMAVQSYRSLRDLILPLGQLTAVTGANGSGQSSVYRPLRFADAAQNPVVASLAHEGGLPSTFWAGPEAIARGVRQRSYAVEPLKNRKVASLKLGFGGDEYGYSTTWATLPRHPRRRCLDSTRISSASAFGKGRSIGTPLLSSIASWQTAFDGCKAFITRVKAAGGNAQMLYPLDHSIRGNSHMIMQDKKQSSDRQPDLEVDR